MIRLILIFIFIHSSFFISGQQVYYASPVKIPMFLSGSFAELRNNHFHSGIDIKTRGTINIPVYAVADGFISRISVSPTGFGNTIYIDHDNGTTSVYGHLNIFRPDIQKYIKDIQYERKSFSVDVPVLPGIFPVKKDEAIALSGNSGSSAGPHLHFELRNTKTEDPINPLKFGFLVRDKTPPVILAVQIVPLSESSHVNNTNSKIIYDVELDQGKYRIKNNPSIQAYGEIGFAVEAYDLTDGSQNKCGISTMELKIDGVIYSVIKLNRFSFEESGTVNSYIDYAEFIKSGRRFQKTWPDRCNGFSGFDYTEKNGIYDPGFDKVHDVKIEIKDSYGNSSVLEFSFEGKYREINAPVKEYSVVFKCGQPNQWKTEDFSIELPQNALFSDLYFEYGTKETKKGFLSQVYEIHNNSVPLNKNVKIAVKTNQIEESLQGKALLVMIDTENEKLTSAGGKYENGWMVGEIKSLGNYSVYFDTIPPVITPLSITDKSTLTDQDKIIFRITDNLSGIEKFEGLMDGKWALFEYDAKNNLIAHQFDAERFELNKKHELKLTVTDFTGNSSVYEATFEK